MTELASPAPANRTVIRRIAAVTALVVVATTLVACQNGKVGGRCKPGTVAQDPTHVLVCRGGKWARLISKADGLRELARIQAEQAAAAAAANQPPATQPPVTEPPATVPPVTEPPATVPPTTATPTTAPPTVPPTSTTTTSTPPSTTSSTSTTTSTTSTMPPTTTSTTTSTTTTSTTTSTTVPPTTSTTTTTTTPPGGSGDLDATFGSNGVSTLTLPKQALNFESVATTSGGTTYVMSSVGSAPSVRSIRKVSAAGQFDPAFGTNGALSPSTCGNCRIAVDEQNHLYYFSYGFDSFGVPASVVTRYTSGGVLDTTYGSNGQVAVAGTGWGAYFVSRAGRVAMLNTSNGQVALITGSGQATTTATPPGTCGMYSSGNFDTQGRFLVLGSYCSGPTTSGPAVIRFTPAGLDTGFGVGGRLMLAAGPAQTFVSRLVVDGSDRLVVFADRYVWRLTPDGATDSTFAGGNAALLAETGSRTSVMAAIAADTGEVYALLRTPNGSFNEDFAVSKLLSNGQVDGTFGIGGVMVPPAFAGLLDSPFGLAPQNTPSLAASGSGVLIVANTKVDDPLVGELAANAFLRLGGDGSPVPAYGTNSILTVREAPLVLPIGGTWPGPNGSIYIAFERQSTQGIVLARVASTGGLDSSFSGDGIVVDTTAAAVTVDAAGRPVLFRMSGVGGTLSFGSTGAPVTRSAVRLTTSGAADSSFGGGVVTWPDLTVAPGAIVACDTLLTPMSDGSIVAAYTPAGGYAECSSTGLDRISSNGALTQGWGSGLAGVAGTRTVRAVAAASSGRTVLAISTMGQQDARLVRLTAAGAVDGGFGTGGVIELNDNGMYAQVGVLGDDSVVVSASMGAMNSFSAGGIDIRRFLVNGTAVTTGDFGPTGKMHDTGTQRTTVSTGHIFTAGFNADPGFDSTEGFVLAARPDGNPETSFPRPGDDGRADFPTNFQVLPYPVISGQRGFVALVNRAGNVEIRKFSGTLS